MHVVVQWSDQNILVKGNGEGKYQNLNMQYIIQKLKIVDYGKQHQVDTVELVIKEMFTMRKIYRVMNHCFTENASKKLSSHKIRQTVEVINNRKSNKNMINWCRLHGRMDSSHTLDGNRVKTG